MSVILGLTSSHDASACVFIDGRLAAAISQERVTRRKNDGYRLPLNAMEHASASRRCRNWTACSSFRR